MSQRPNINLRPAEPADVELIFSMVIALAAYERSPDQVNGSPELLAGALFGEKPQAEALIAEVAEQIAGFALFHGTFSTWECRPGIWLEDLYVLPEHRRLGVGHALLARLAQITLTRGGSRLQWTALEWNAPALKFYEKLAADRLEEWRTHRLSGQGLAALAASAPPV